MPSDLKLYLETRFLKNTLILKKCLITLLQQIVKGAVMNSASCLQLVEYAAAIRKKGLTRNILSLFQRESIDQRSFGDLFRACNEELANITFIDALRRIMQLVMNTLRNTHNLSERVINSMLDLTLGKAITYFGLNNKLKLKLTAD